MLGRSLLRSLARDVTGGIVGGLAFGAGSALIDNLLGGSQPAPAGNYIPQSVPNPSSSGTTVANIALARIALCYYIAKADGVISPEEQMDLDYMCSSLMNNPNASASFRNELQQIVTDRSSNFMNVEKYLNRLDANTLSTLQADAQRIAELTDGVTENERKAMSVFQNYVYGKQGFPGGNMNGQFAGAARIVSLKCSGCGADLQINTSHTETFCPYCGTRQIIMH
jgi:DNA-directed RNA polymerase subunit RPC12/RpoP